MSLPQRICQRSTFKNNPFDDGDECENVELICAHANAQFVDFVSHFAPDFSWLEANRWAQRTRFEDRRSFHHRSQRTPQFHPGNRQNRDSPHWKQSNRPRTPFPAPNSQHFTTNQTRGFPPKWYQKSPKTPSADSPTPTEKKELKFTPVQSCSVPLAGDGPTGQQVKSDSTPARPAPVRKIAHVPSAEEQIALLIQSEQKEAAVAPVVENAPQEDIKDAQPVKIQNQKKKNKKRNKAAKKENQPELKEAVDQANEALDQNASKPEKTHDRRSFLVDRTANFTVTFTPPRKPLWFEHPRNLQEKTPNPMLQQQKFFPRKGPLAIEKPADGSSERIAITPHPPKAHYKQYFNAEPQTPDQVRRQLRITHPSGAIRTPPSNEVQFKYRRFSAHQRQQQDRVNNNDEKPK